MQNPASSTIQAYYNSIESRLGYRMFLGDTRRSGYYFSETSWPWPICEACGVGHVALYMAQNGGFHVECIDPTPHHVAKAAQNVRLAEADQQVSVKLGDYHDLHAFENGGFESVYTMKSLVHSTNTRKILQEFLRVLKPGGCLVMHEYEFETDELKRLARNVGFEDIELVDMSKHIVPML